MFEKLKNIREKLKSEPEFSDVKSTSHSSFREVIGGEVLKKGFARKQVGVLVLLVILSFFYIGNRYYCEKQLAQIDRLQQELTKAKYTYLTISSELMTLSRQSQVEGLIKQKGIELEESVTPPYVLK